jgi:hypothetical protein
VFACCWPVWGRVCGGAAFHSPPPTPLVASIIELPPRSFPVRI